MSRTASREIIKDDAPLFEGTHKGATSTVLIDPGANFRSLGVDPTLLLYCENETQATHGYIQESTEDTATMYSPDNDTAFFILNQSGFPYTFEGGSAMGWNNGDTYKIYATSRKNSVLGSHWVDVSRGWKIEKHEDVNDQGWRHEDWDIDNRGRSDVFGPGQPE